MINLSTLVRWLVLTLSVWVAAVLLPGIDYDTLGSLFVASLVLSLLNIFVKPIVTLLSIPFIVVTFGFFLLVINALLLKLTAWLVPGFLVANMGSAIGGSIVISLVSFFLGRTRRSDFRIPRPAEPTPQDGPPPGKGPIIDV
ncbi:MAG: phage holin family protein [Lentisphaerae bacterium]|nr:phage holin family protein [Lentisphaerota bacterium]